MNKTSNIVLGITIGLVIGFITGYVLMNNNIVSLESEKETLVDEKNVLESQYSELLSDYDNLKLQELLFKENKKILADRSEGKLRIINMTASQYSFDPNLITVDLGDIVVLRIWSTLDRQSGFSGHGFALTEWYIDEFLPKDTWTTIIFVADKLGEFYFGCQIPCGIEHSDMIGKIIIQEP